MTTTAINFEHRIPWGSDEQLQTFRIEDAGIASLARAKAVAELLETAAAWDEGLSHVTVRAAAEVIRLELSDAALLAKICAERESTN
ncbi:hypothetical protein [Methylomonas fluvii]|uniref:Uncharacterized protein n=1 Tax=Methylomonas fluvii TaxID=1854564 RepID=A0ABR9DKL6_9GAMM|nr:hypothetical protein [Methylomonas fluvii]MBD9362769.1 hypothetical protein [Methylomonas fluvii]